MARPTSPPRGAIVVAVVIALAVGTGACAGRTPRDRAIDYWALYYAAAADNDLLVKALLDRGAPVDALDVDAAGEISYQAIDLDSPLQAAADAGHVEIVAILLDHKPWVDHRCCDSPAALGMAARKGHLKIVEMLLAAGADPTIETNYGDLVSWGTPLDAARAAGHEDVGRVLEAAMKAWKPPAAPHE